MDKTEDILTEMMEDAIDRVYEQLEAPEPSAKISGYTVTAITNAAKQIKEQQRGRVEEVMRYATHRRTCAVNNHPSDWCNCGFKAALKELEK